MKLTKKFIFIFSVFFMGALGGIFANHILLPYLVSNEFFSKCKFLKKTTEDVVIINKTEQVYVKEESTLEKVVNQASASVVEVVAYEKESRKIKNVEMKKTTGFVATNDGMIITYADSVISPEANYKIITSDGSSYDAEFWGIDPYSNLAFLKISANGLKAVSFADSSDAKPGEKIVAVGSADGKFRQKYASGLLSSVASTYNLAGKTVSSSEKLEGVFFSDFGLDQGGFLGSPVVDYSGQTVGVVGSIARDNRKDFFLIPANKVRKSLEKAIRMELMDSPYLGIYYLPITKNLMITKNISAEKGVLVFSPSGQQGLAVISGSPADKADLKVGDIITTINNDEINLDNSLSDLLYKYKKGQEIEIKLLRDGNEMKVKVQL